MKNQLQTPSTLGFGLPIVPNWASEPPAGTMEDGIRLSIAIIESVKNRPEVFEERDRQRVDVEFVM